MDVFDQLTAIKSMNQTNLKKGPTAIRNEYENYLHTEMVRAKREADEAPGNASLAEERYYDYTDSSYEDKTLVRNAPTVKRGIEQQHERVLNTVNASIANYESQRAYLNNMSDIFFNLQEKINDNASMLDNNLADDTTNQQKVYYLNQEYETLDHVNYLLFLALIGIVGMVLENMYDKRLWTNQPLFISTMSFIAVLLFTGSSWFDYVTGQLLALVGVISSYRPIIYATF